MRFKSTSRFESQNANDAGQDVRPVFRPPRAQRCTISVLLAHFAECLLCTTYVRVLSPSSAAHSPSDAPDQRHDLLEGDVFFALRFNACPCEMVLIVGHILVARF